ncbi:MAG: hypothetical protein QG594_1979, partial [Bacteroidota bacterium]|nr:hypothetical protein [Bacteroidota bacterium]
EFSKKKYLCPQKNKMEAIEFLTRIENGILQLPLELAHYNNVLIRITVLPQPLSDLQLKKARLRAIMLKMGEKNIFSQISDGVKWQKQLRNEWE